MGDGTKRPQPDLSFDELYKQAVASVPVWENSAQGLLDRLKSQNPELSEGVVFEMEPVKEYERALDKIDTDYGGDHRKIKDLVRGQFVVDTPEQIVALKEAILEEMEIDSMKDKFAEPTSQGYRDINTKIELENGHIAEIQVQQRGMPPEVQALIEVKESSILFEQQFEEIKEYGGLSAVAEYMENNPIEPGAAQTYEADHPAVQTAYATGLNF